MINYTNPDRERFVNIAAMALFNVRIKDRFDNYHLTKIDCDFPTLVESLNF